MEAFEHALFLLLITTVLSVLARWLPWPAPITQVLGGALVALLPRFPVITLDPGFFFLCFLPPLLFADGWLMPLREFTKARRAILMLAIGLVTFTTLTVGLTAHWLVPGLPLSLAFALGAVVSPTDAVAVGAITSRLKVPRRLTTVLNGESLMNDATGLVAFKFAIAALVAGTFSVREVAASFVVVAVGGFAVGLAVGYLVGRLRDLLRRLHASDPFIEITVSLMTPFAAYLIAEPLGVSGILSVVAAGLYSGWRDPIRMDAEVRQTAWAVWSMVLFWLNGLAFLLLGIQFPRLLDAVSHEYSPAELAVFTAGVAGVAVVGRILWMFPGAYFPFWLSRRVRETEVRPRWQAVAVAGWAGMRGTVTLAAAMSLPLTLPDGTPFPHRDIVIFLAFGVIAVTLLLQGTTLEWVIRRLGLREDDSRAQEERLARTTAVDAGLLCLRAEESGATDTEEAAALGEVIAEYERRLVELTTEGETQASAGRRRAAGRRHRLAAVQAERQAINDLWRRNVISDEVHRPLQQLLDYEESMLVARPSAGGH
ncbi:MAG: Na+/H+ antiporter [Verrucomicrobiales bacterium]|nr:Na+/H+ antiporter [Verrucomicrobiales bacterium]